MTGIQHTQSPLAEAALWDFAICSPCIHFFMYAIIVLMMMTIIIKSMFWHFSTFDWQSWSLLSFFYFYFRHLTSRAVIWTCALRQWRRDQVLLLFWFMQLKQGWTKVWVEWKTNWRVWWWLISLSVSHISALVPFKLLFQSERHKKKMLLGTDLKYKMVLYRSAVR